MSSEYYAPGATMKTIAQKRRQMENREFSELAKELPLSRAISAQHIDKTSMVRLAVTYIKLHTILPTNTSTYSSFDAFWCSNALDLMDSFLMVLDSKGDILYVSETISIYLGLSQVEMTGSAIHEYVHADDWTKFQSTFQYTINWIDTCNVRVKSSLTKRANKDSGSSSPGYKVLKMDFIGHGSSRLVHCSPLPALILSTVSILPYSFVLTTSVDLSILSSDEKAEDYLCDFYNRTAGLKGKSFYSLIHPTDIETIRKMHYEVFALGAYRTPYFSMILRQQSQTFFVEAIVYRYSSAANKTSVDTITIIINCL